MTKISTQLDNSSLKIYSCLCNHLNLYQAGTVLGDKILNCKMPFLLLIWLPLYFINYSFSLNLLKCSAKNMTLSRRSFYHHKEKRKLSFCSWSHISLTHDSESPMVSKTPKALSVSVFHVKKNLLTMAWLWQTSCCSNWLRPVKALTLSCSSHMSHTNFHGSGFWCQLQLKHSIQGRIQGIWGIIHGEDEKLVLSFQ